MQNDMATQAIPTHYLCQQTELSAMFCEAQAEVTAHAAFAALVERNAHFLYRVAYSLLRNPHDAEDAVQECLLKLHRTGGWQGMQDEKAFLARSCWRAALDRLPCKDVAFTDAAEMEIADEAETPEAAAVEQAQAARLHRLIDALPLDLRQPLLLSSFEELNSREIGEVLRIPEGTVRTRLKRAREELRRQWVLLERKRIDNKSERRMR